MWEQELYVPGTEQELKKVGGAEAFGMVLVSIFIKGSHFYPFKICFPTVSEIFWPQ